MAVLVHNYKASASPTATQTNVHLIDVPATPAVSDRSLAVVNTTDVVVTVEWDFLDANGNVYDMVKFTLPAGNVTKQASFISSAGAVTPSGSAPTVTAGAYANLVAVCSSGETLRYSATSPTLGSVQLDLVEIEVN
jgi:hypothetical protein